MKPPRATKRKPKGSISKVGLGHDGEFDELFAFGAFVHIERMSDTSMWFSIEAGGRRFCFHTGVHRGIWYFRADEDKIDGEEYVIQRPRRGKVPKPSGNEPPKPQEPAKGRLAKP